MQLVMLGGGAKIPQDRLALAREQREAAHLVLRPGTDVRGSDVTHVVHVKAQNRAHFRFGEKILHALQTFRAQPIEVNALFPINRHCSMRW